MVVTAVDSAEAAVGVDLVVALVVVPSGTKKKNGMLFKRADGVR